jgi:ubiquinone biosynthesis protein UbiJ
MDALETLLKPITAMINRQIEAKTPARELCEELADRALAVRVDNTALSVYLVVTDGTLQIAATPIDDPDVIITGSLISLARLAGPAGEDLIRDGVVEITGDAIVAHRFQKLLSYGRPDLEEEISAVVGDVAAHGIGEFARSLGAWGREASDTMRQNLGEYLQEESRVAPSRYEVNVFRDEVETLRDDVARFDARLKKLEQSAGSSNEAGS